MQRLQVNSEQGCAVLGSVIFTMTISKYTINVLKSMFVIENDRRDNGNICFIYGYREKNPHIRFVILWF